MTWVLYLLLFRTGCSYTMGTTIQQTFYTKEECLRVSSILTKKFTANDMTESKSICVEQLSPVK